jgi:hypothetical protein
MLLDVKLHIAYLQPLPVQGDRPGHTRSEALVPSTPTRAGRPLSKLSELSTVSFNPYACRATSVFLLPPGKDMLQPLRRQGDPKDARRSALLWPSTPTRAGRPFDA